MTTVITVNIETNNFSPWLLPPVIYINLTSNINISNGRSNQFLKQVGHLQGTLGHNQNDGNVAQH